MDDVLFAQNIPAYKATRKRRTLKVTLQVVAQGAESAALLLFGFDCSKSITVFFINGPGTNVAGCVKRVVIAVIPFKVYRGHLC